MADWTEERHGHAKVAAEECQARGYTVTSEPGSILDMLNKIEQLKLALTKANDRADAAEAKLRRYEGGSAAGMLDRS